MEKAKELRTPSQISPPETSEKYACSFVLVLFAENRVEPPNKHFYVSGRNRSKGIAGRIAFLRTSPASRENI